MAFILCGLSLPAHYARWCKANITDNEFAEENVDFTPFFLNEECGGQVTTDYKLSAHFVKKLSMKRHDGLGLPPKNKKTDCQKED